MLAVGLVLCVLGCRVGRSVAPLVVFWGACALWLYGWSLWRVWVVLGHCGRPIGWFLFRIYLVWLVFDDRVVRFLNAERVGKGGGGEGGEGEGASESKRE